MSVCYLGEYNVGPDSRNAAKVLLKGVHNSHWCFRIYEAFLREEMLIISSSAALRDRCAMLV